MDKASIIKDAIDYIQELHEQEKRIQVEIRELESEKSNRNPANYDFFDQEVPRLRRLKKMKVDNFYDSGGSRAFPIEVLEMKVTEMGEKTVMVSITCSRRWRVAAESMMDGRWRLYRCRERKFKLKLRFMG
ncbi:hypothetical protein SLE2022_290880 [Rubroshorea leprosula]